MDGPMQTPLNQMGGDFTYHFVHLFRPTLAPRLSTIHPAPSTRDLPAGQPRPPTNNGAPSGADRTRGRLPLAASRLRVAGWLAGWAKSEPVQLPATDCSPPETPIARSWPSAARRRLGPARRLGSPPAGQADRTLYRSTLGAGLGRVASRQAGRPAEWAPAWASPPAGSQFAAGPVPHSCPRRRQFWSSRRLLPTRSLAPTTGDTWRWWAQPALSSSPARQAQAGEPIRRDSNHH